MAATSTTLLAEPDLRVEGEGDSGLGVMLKNLVEVTGEQPCHGAYRIVPYRIGCWGSDKVLGCRPSGLQLRCSASGRRGLVPTNKYRPTLYYTTALGS